MQSPAGYIYTAKVWGRRIVYRLFNHEHKAMTVRMAQSQSVILLPLSLVKHNTIVLIDRLSMGAGDQKPN